MEVTCSKCSSLMEIDTVDGEQYITESNGEVHHAHDCAAILAGE